MPRDIAGNYTLPAGNPVVPNTIIASNWANITMQDIATALTNSLSIDGSVTTAKIADDAVTPPKLNGLDVDGMVARISSTEFEGRTLTSTTTGLAITNGDGAAGNPSFALDADLQAISQLAGTGIAVRTAADTWAQRTITGTANKITVTNGDGVSGNPTLTIPANPLLDGPIVKIRGSGTGNSNDSYVQFMESDGATARGFVGMDDSRNAVTLGSNSGGLHLFSTDGSVVINGSEVYRRANVVGSVSQSGGVPTGAVVETGSNANGRYARFADGTQICWFAGASSVSSTSGYITGLSAHVLGAWTFPATFASGTISVSGSVFDSGAIGFLSSTSVTTTSASLAYVTPTAGPGSVFVQLMAFGRWY